MFILSCFVALVFFFVLIFQTLATIMPPIRISNLLNPIAIPMLIFVARIATVTCWSTSALADRTSTHGRARMACRASTDLDE